ncbi:MAG: hypothetical protein ACM31L_20045 [Actinomycetota bacterium]
MPASVYNEIIAPWRAIVDRMLIDTVAEGWEVRRAYLASVYAALQRGHQKAPLAVDPEAALSDIVAALIERLDTPPIDNRLQAGIYATSALPAHQVAAAAWFDRNPDEYAAIQKELEGGLRLN